VSNVLALTHPANYRGCKAFIAKQSKEPHKAVDEIRRRAPVSSLRPSISGKSFAEVAKPQSTPSAPPLPEADPTVSSIYALLQQLSAQIAIIPQLSARLEQLEQNSKVQPSRKTTGNKRGTRQNG